MLFQALSTLLLAASGSAAELSMREDANNTLIDDMLSSLSKNCRGQIEAMSVGTYFSDGLATASLYHILKGDDTDDTVGKVNNYLDNLCDSSTVTLSMYLIDRATKEINDRCDEDDLKQVDNWPSIYLWQLKNYVPYWTGACSWNDTTHSWCVTNTLETIQDNTGEPLERSFVFAFMEGNQSAVERFEGYVKSMDLCTGCVEKMWNQALVASNGSLAYSSLQETFSTRCGETFGVNPTPAQVEFEVPSVVDSSAPGSDAKWSADLPGRYLLAAVACVGLGALAVF